MNTEKENEITSSSLKTPFQWTKVAYGGMQPGFADNHIDERFLDDIVTNASVVKRDMLKVILDSVAISQYISIVSLVIFTWIKTLTFHLTPTFLLFLNSFLVALGFSAIFLTNPSISPPTLRRNLLNIAFFVSGLYVFSPVYQTLTKSISSDSIWAVTASLVILHLFLHDYYSPGFNTGVHPNPGFTNFISLNASLVASTFVASRLPSSLYVFSLMLFSLLVFLFAPLVTFGVRNYSFVLHIWFSLGLVLVTLFLVRTLQTMFFLLLSSLLIFVNLLCPFWLIRVQKYKFEINGPWDETKLCFDITDESNQSRFQFSDHRS